MAKHTEELTDKFIRGIEPSNSATEIFDGGAEGIGGFGVSITPNGKKSYILRSRVNVGGKWKTARYKLADVGEANVRQARKMAVEYKATLKGGGDPDESASRERANRLRNELDARIEAAREMTFADLADLYIDRHCKGVDFERTGVPNIKTWRQEELMFESDSKVGLIRDYRLTEITRRHISELTHDVGRKHGIYAANRLFELIRRMFNWALDEGYIEVTPIGRMKKLKGEKPRDRTLSDEEILEIWKACEDDKVHGAIVRLLFVTAARRGEVTGMKWSEIDTEKKEWVVPAERSKNGRSHLIPLSSLTLEILKTLPRNKKIDHVFPSRRWAKSKECFSGFSKSKRALDHAIAVARCEGSQPTEEDLESRKLPEWRLHDIRRTVRTRLSRLATKQIADKVLNHVDQSVDGQHYDFYDYADEKRAALEDWSAMLRSIVGAPPPETNTDEMDNVVTLKVGMG